MHDPTQHPFTTFAGIPAIIVFSSTNFFDNNDPVPIIVLFGILLPFKKVQPAPTHT